MLPGKEEPVWMANDKDLPAFLKTQILTLPLLSAEIKVLWRHCCRSRVTAVTSLYVDSMMARAEEEADQGGEPIFLEELQGRFLNKVFAMLHEKPDKQIVRTCACTLASNKKLGPGFWKTYIADIRKHIVSGAISEEAAAKGLEAVALGAARSKQDRILTAIISSSKEANVKIDLEARDDYAMKWTARNEMKESFVFVLKETGRYPSEFDEHPDRLAGEMDYWRNKIAHEMEVARSTKKQG